MPNLVTQKGGCLATYSNYVNAGLVRADKQEKFFGMDMNLALHRDPVKYSGEHYFKAAGQHLIGPFVSALKVAGFAIKLIFDIVLRIPEGFIVGVLKGKCIKEVGTAFGRVGKDIESIGRNIIGVIPLAGPYLLDVYAASMAKLTGEQLPRPSWPPVTSNVSRRPPVAPSQPKNKMEPAPVPAPSATHKSQVLNPVKALPLTGAPQVAPRPFIDVLSYYGTKGTAVCKQLMNFTLADIEYANRIISRLKDEDEIEKLSNEEKEALNRAECIINELAGKEPKIESPLEDQLRFAFEVVETLYMIQPMYERIFFPESQVNAMKCLTNRVEQLKDLVDKFENTNCDLQMFIKFYLVQIENKINEAEGYTGPATVTGNINKAFLDQAMDAWHVLIESGLDASNLNVSYPVFNECRQRLALYYNDVH